MRATSLWRYADIADVRYEIEEVLGNEGGIFVQPATTAKPGKKLQFVLPWIAVTAVLTAVIVGLVVWYLKPMPPPESRQVIRLDCGLLEDQVLGPELTIPGHLGELSAYREFESRRFQHSVAKRVPNTQLFENFK